MNETGATAEIYFPVNGSTAAGGPFQRGLACCQRGDYDNALIEFTAALQGDPTNAATLTQRGDVFRLRGDSLAALADYSAAIRADPEFRRARVARGLTYQQLGQPDEA